METQLLPVWLPDLPQCSGLFALQRSQTVTGPGSPEEQYTHTNMLAILYCFITSGNRVGWRGYHLCLFVCTGYFKNLSKDFDDIFGSGRPGAKEELIQY